MFIPHTDQDRAEMLDSIGIKHIDNLFDDIPISKRFPNLNLPPALTEMEVSGELERLADQNKSVRELICFLGAGAYNHYSPSVVDSIIQRGEYLTAYTPYQAEISQGTLQAIFDYQSLITALTAMDVSNASHYDGATAIAEAVNMAFAVYRGKKTKIILSPALHPHYRETVDTYNQGSDLEIIGSNQIVDPLSDPDSIIPMIDDNTALVMVQYPDFFGRVFDFTTLAAAVHEAGALFGVSVNPLSLGLLIPPGEFGADIVTGEGQSLGLPLSFGGPYLGIFATRDKYVRKMAGRIVGETIDVNGKRAYVLTLTAREQHIRRDKATSNICTNQGIMALASTVYLSIVGKQGLREVAELCYHKAHYAAAQINALTGYHVLSDVPFFNEFIVRCPVSVKEINQSLLQKNILGGFDLGDNFPALENHMLIAVTEMNSKKEIDLLVKSLAEVVND